jgi:hypothetical protein
MTRHEKVLNADELHFCSGERAPAHGWAVQPPEGTAATMAERMREVPPRIEWLSGSGSAEQELALAEVALPTPTEVRLDGGCLREPAWFDPWEVFHDGEFEGDLLTLERTLGFNGRWSVRLVWYSVP